MPLSKSEIEAVALFSAWLDRRMLAALSTKDLPAMKARVEPIIGEWTKKSPLIAEFVTAAQAAAAHVHSMARA